MAKGTLNNRVFSIIFQICNNLMFSDQTNGFDDSCLRKEKTFWIICDLRFRISDLCEILLLLNLNLLLFNSQNLQIDVNLLCTLLQMHSTGTRGRKKRSDPEDSDHGPRPYPDPVRMKTTTWWRSYQTPKRRILIADLHWWLYQKLKIL